MTKLVAMFIVTMLACESALGESLLATSDYWRRLLHFDGVQSEVVSEEFFLSENGNKDPVGEQNEMVRLLNSTRGMDVACSFPARYLWLSKQKIHIPNFELKECDELQAFVRNFQKDTLSIVYVSEFIDVPASAFGHIMLSFQDTNIPLPLADAIHFSAKTEKDSFFMYSYKGLTGRYDGNFIREPLFLKQSGYNVSEQRALHFYRLNFSNEEILRIVLHLYELRKATFRYYFIRENCAYQIGQLLEMAMPDENRGFENEYSVLPMEIVRKYSDRIIDWKASPPSLLRAEVLIDKLSADDQSKIENVIDQHEIPSDLLTDQIKEVLALYYQYAFRRQGVIYGNYAAVRSLQYSSKPFDSSLRNPLAISELNRASFGLFMDRGIRGLLLEYRPMLRDIFDVHPDALQESEMKLFDMQIIADNLGARLEKLDFVKVRSLPRRNILRKDVSWEGYAGVNRANEAKDIRPEIELGIGQSFGNHSLTLNGSTSVGLQAYAGTKAYIKPSICFIIYVSDDVKFGNQLYDKFLPSAHYLQNELFLSAKLGRGTLRVLHTFVPSKESRLSFIYGMSI